LFSNYEGDWQGSTIFEETFWEGNIGFKWGTKGTVCSILDWISGCISFSKKIIAGNCNVMEYTIHNKIKDSNLIKQTPRHILFYLQEIGKIIAEMRQQGSNKRIL